MSGRAQNMGAWNTSKYYIDRTLEIIQVKGEKVKYIGRNAAHHLLQEILTNTLQNKKKY